MAKLTNVACKLPSGLLLSHGKAQKDGDDNYVVDPINGGVKMDAMREVRLYGSLFRSNPDTDPNDFGGVVGGFGITKGVDAEWFDDWIKTHGPYLPFVQEGAIFAFEKEADIAAKSREMRGLKSGFQPLEENDDRVPEAKNVLTHSEDRTDQRRA